MLLLTFCLILTSNVCKSQETTSPPDWAPTHSVKGILNIPYAELAEPFSAWFDQSNTRSRIDYYGDMVKTYQISSLGKYGASFKIAPVTTEEFVNKKVCMRTDGVADGAIKPQAILPNLNGFERTGKEYINGQLAEKWTYIDTVGDKVNRYFMWLTYKSIPGVTSNPLPVPIRYEMRGYNTLLGSHYDHYYLDYIDYDISDIPEDIFALNLNDCTYTPFGPMTHTYHFNPMAEFIPPQSTEHVEFEFSKFKNKHSKKYDDDIEEIRRKSSFQQNLRYINSFNRKNKGYTLSVNHLADRTDAELRVMRGNRPSNITYNGGLPFPYDHTFRSLQIPTSYDWRIYGAVTPVKDQSVCGSCWSYGATGAVEGAYFLKTGTLTSFSQQALIDCTWGFGNNGCDGGEDFRAYWWMLKHGGIPTEAEYGPYLAQDGYCHVQNLTLQASIKGFVNVTSNEDALRLALFKHGPVAVGIDASHKSFVFYSHGIYYEPKCRNTEDDLDHAVLAVGYGSINGQNYWLIKNSWSNHWGNDGYVLMSSKNNNCGVLTTPKYVVM